MSVCTLFPNTDSLSLSRARNLEGGHPLHIFPLPELLALADNANVFAQERRVAYHREGEVQRGSAATAQRQQHTAGRLPQGRARRGVSLGGHTDGIAPGCRQQRPKQQHRIRDARRHAPAHARGPLTFTGGI